MAPAALRSNTKLHMCGTSRKGAASVADSDVVRPAALAAAVIMIAVGFVIVVHGL